MGKNLHLPVINTFWDRDMYFFQKSSVFLLLNVYGYVWVDHCSLKCRKVFHNCFFFKLRSLFMVACETNVLRAIWDVYLLEADPFLVFFLMLVMVINGRLELKHFSMYFIFLCFIFTPWFECNGYPDISQSSWLNVI